MYSNTVPTTHRTSELDLGKRRPLRSKVFLRRFKRPKKKTDRVVAETAVITAGRWFGRQASATCSQIGLVNLTIFISDEAVYF